MFLLQLLSKCFLKLFLGLFLLMLSLMDLFMINFVVTLQADFMKMPFSDNTFDAVYEIDATCHAPDVVHYFTIIHNQFQTFV